MIRFACPECRKGFQVEDEFAGRKTKCPNCNGALVIPSAAVCNSSSVATQRAPALSPGPLLKPHHGSSAAVDGRGGDQLASRQQPTQIAAEKRDGSTGLGTATKVVMGVCGVVCGVVVGWFVWFVVTRDT